MDGKQIRILCVTEDRTDSEAVNNILDHYDAAMYSTSSFAEAKSTLEMHPVDLIIAMIGTDSLTDFTSWADLQSKAPESKLIIITQTGTVATYLNAHLLGVFDYFFHPIEPNTLRSTIDRALYS